MRKGYLFRIAVVLTSIILTACAGTQVVDHLTAGSTPSKAVQESTAPSTSVPPKTTSQPDNQPTLPKARSDRPENQAIADLADRLSVPASSIQIVEVEAVEWRDGNLGCAKPDKRHSQAIIPGLRILLKSGNQVYEYHSGAGSKPILCENDGAPTLPPFRATPGDIKDGVPWVPVK